MDLRKCMDFKVVNNINLIGAMELSTKPGYNIYIEQRLTILKNIFDKRITPMKINLDIYGACHHKTTFHLFCISIDDPVNGQKGWTVQRFLNLRF